VADTSEPGCEVIAPRFDDLEDSGQLFAMAYVKLPNRLIIVHVHRTLDTSGTNTRSRRRR
jgi:hypothetical protein